MSFVSVGRHGRSQKPLNHSFGRPALESRERCLDLRVLFVPRPRPSADLRGHPGDEGRPAAAPESRRARELQGPRWTLSEVGCVLFVPRTQTRGWVFKRA